MYIPIIKNSPKPAYQQIIDSIRKRILTGELMADEELPSIRRLAKNTKVSIITVRRSYGDLEREGLIYSRPGMGYYVSEFNQQMLDDAKIKLITPLLQEVVNTAKELQLNEKKVKDLLNKMLEEKVQKGGRPNG
ncbi:GntR family transcriptional regulator [Desulfofalx alkaliphila]|uniref:GntR family transcriptional regulator n=1 Tax=Desulfofalx alkaliphila TaxID=105483 RepID=UPI0004E0C2C6|nr:GntR family transcriptional regulator [Desulfofalx alkaliphila]